jgi:hypothetical protein
MSGAVFHFVGAAGAVLNPQPAQELFPLGGLSRLAASLFGPTAQQLLYLG